MRALKITLIVAAAYSVGMWLIHACSAPRLQVSMAWEGYQAPSPVHWPSLNPDDLDGLLELTVSFAVHNPYSSEQDARNELWFFIYSDLLSEQAAATTYVSESSSPVSGFEVSSCARAGCDVFVRPGQTAHIKVLYLLEERLQTNSGKHLKFSILSSFTPKDWNLVKPASPIVGFVFAPLCGVGWYEINH